ncbi:PTS sugar transporter subunit IIA [Garciella nitratireducens]|uniref:PTS system IIA component, Glc family (TC 4.A.1) n=1 Tax=Garciella nitratireducens DSM 15102 TaxID=1121911 RepID=A0A1T4KH16_9FIRM|nr:PTS glucose transporter subunit IIA [Garciella nitratireducens]RBP41538.1 PTS system IIA component (Glc family) [Garciella nitratireducens]SJZ41691.1 PTS system IIA component, Glc family (TC 4.A.1) [Garciella nitratireducens DSM 15102]
MLKNLFNKKIKIQKETIFSPLDGEVLPLENVPDPVFSQKMMGEGVAIIPKSGKVVSPVNGKIISIFPTKHAIGIRSEKGLELLIHIGLETVDLNGEPFELLAKEHKIVKIGEPLLNVDLQLLENCNKEIITPLIITNKEIIKEIEYPNYGEIHFGEVILTCKI